MKRINIERNIDLAKLLKHKSYILLGPRQTGKSWLIKNIFPIAKRYNLLLREDYKKLSFDPSLIRKELKPQDKLIIIDEFQKIPELLDEVHYLIEEFGIKFLLTGSSARKLKKQSLNLLGGRALFARLHPFTFSELKQHFSLEKALNHGLIPGIYFSDQPELDLDGYISTYIQQEIASEGLVRSLPTFTRFLEIAALSNAELINFTSISSDAQIPRTTIHEYFKILEDTLIGHMLQPWQKTIHRKPIATPKFYFFDWSIPKHLQGLGKITPKNEIYGKAFETYIFHELRTFCDYNGLKDLHYWRSKNHDEVDFIINNKIAVEVKASENFKLDYLKSLKRLKDECLLKEYYLIYLGPDLNLEAEPWLKIINYKNFLNLINQKKFISFLKSV